VTGHGDVVMGNPSGSTRPAIRVGRRPRTADLEQAGARCDQVGPDGELLAEGAISVWSGCEGDALVISQADGTVLFGCSPSDTRIPVAKPNRRRWLRESRQVAVAKRQLVGWREAQVRA
jgi:hypothetical protein